MAGPRSKTIISSFKYLFEGSKYIKENSWTRKYIAAALIVDLIVFILLIIGWVLSVSWVSDKILGIFNISSTGVLRVFFQIVLFLFGIILLSRLIVSISTIINSPIYGEMTEKFLRLHNISGVKELTFIEEIIHSIGFEMKKVVILLVLLGVGIFLNFIPVIGQILFFIVSCFQIIIFSGLDFFDPYLARKSLSMSQKIRYITRKPYMHYPFLLTSGFLTSIPLVNVFLLPVFTVSGLLLISQTFEKE